MARDLRGDVGRAWLVSRLATYHSLPGASAIQPDTLFANLYVQGALTGSFRLTPEGPGGYWLLWVDESSKFHFFRWMKSQFGIETESVSAPQPRRRSG